MRTTEVDLLVVGSGPVGCTFARIVRKLRPLITIVQVDAGPRLGPEIGLHVRNIADHEQRILVQKSWADDTARVSRSSGSSAIARPGTRLVGGTKSGRNHGFPAGAMSTNVGGMGVHWSCVTPRPDASESISWIERSDWGRLVTEAEGLLRVSANALEPSVLGRKYLPLLLREYSELHTGRAAQLMPIACTKYDGRVHWTGTNVILGSLLHEPKNYFDIRPLTLCTRIHYEGTRATAAELLDLVKGSVDILRVRMIAIAADSLRTPQLLWASGIRPMALGRHLNDHVQVLAALASTQNVIGQGGDSDQPAGVIWLPYSRRHPFHGQIMHFATAPEGVRHDGSVIGLGWLVPTTISASNRVYFRDSLRDAFGMPEMFIDYSLAQADHEAILAAVDDQKRVADAFGLPFLIGGKPVTLPAGSSLHYQGTFRMGLMDDGQSVCDKVGRVWGLSNVYLAGNGAIPTPTAGNPTLMSCALAVRSGKHAGRHIV